MCHPGQVSVHLVLKACVWVLKIHNTVNWCMQHALRKIEMLFGVTSKHIGYALYAYLRFCCCIGEEVLDGNLCRPRATPKVSMSSAVHIC